MLMRSFSFECFAHAGDIEDDLEHVGFAAEDEDIRLLDTANLSF
jgi:hypothetical protein